MHLLVDTLNQSMCVVLDEIEHLTVVLKVIKKHYTILLAKYNRDVSMQF